jgi:hypothetical protein
MDLRSWPKRWNDTSLRDIATLPEFPSSRPWPLLGMFAVGLVVGATLGGYAVSQRAQMNRLAKRARRMGDELAAMGKTEAVEPMAAETSNRADHRRKATSEV